MSLWFLLQPIAIGSRITTVFFTSSFSCSTFISQPSKSRKGRRLILVSISYPHKTTRILEKVDEDTSQWSYIRYKVYTSVPFLYEINSLLEWTTTRTALEMSKWFTVEEIHRMLYQALYDVCAYWVVHCREKVLWRMTSISKQSLVLQRKRFGMDSWFSLELWYVSFRLLRLDYSCSPSSPLLLFFSCSCQQPCCVHECVFGFNRITPIG